jgi:hypothetical protein
MSRRALTLKKYHLVFLEGSVSIAVSKKNEEESFNTKQELFKSFHPEGSVGIASYDTYIISYFVRIVNVK